MASSKTTIKHTQPKRGQIKIKILKMFGKSLKKLANGVTGEQRKVAGNDVIKKNRPVRGQIKVKIFKMIFNSIKDLANGVVVGTKKAAENRCFNLPATVFPGDNVEEMKLESGGEKGTTGIEIKIWKTSGGSVFEFSDSGGKKKGAVHGGHIPMVGIFPVEL